MLVSKPGTMSQKNIMDPLIIIEILQTVSGIHQA